MHDVRGWENIHDKAMPLMLPLEDNTLLDKWLDPAFDALAFRGRASGSGPLLD